VYTYIYINSPKEATLRLMMNEGPPSSTSVYMYIYIYVFIDRYVCIFKHIYIHICIYIYIYKDKQSKRSYTQADDERRTSLFYFYREGLGVRIGEE
jgi:hypothetical protein